jgi:hypothetical protein
MAESNSITNSVEELIAKIKQIIEKYLTLNTLTEYVTSTLNTGMFTTNKDAYRELSLEENVTISFIPQSCAFMIFQKNIHGRTRIYEVSLLSFYKGVESFSGDPKIHEIVNALYDCYKEVKQQVFESPLTFIV